MRRYWVTWVLVFADAMAFVSAGTLGLLFAMAIGNASFTEAGALFNFDDRERLNDFLLAGTAWITWFLVFKNRYRKPVPFWSEFSESVRTVLLLALINLAIIALARNDYSRSIWFLGWILLIPLIPLYRTIGRYGLLWLGGLSRPTWIIGSGENVEEAQLAFDSEWQMGFDVRGVLAPDGLTSSGLMRILDQIGGTTVYSPSDVTVVVAVEESVDVGALILNLTLAGVQSIYVIPSLRGIPLYGADLTYFFSHEVLLLGVRNNLSVRFSKLLKRAFDLVAATFLMIPAGLILSIAGLLIWFEDGKPIFYVQRRLGYLQKEFGMLKLRTMRTDAEAQLAEWRSKDSPEWKTYCANNFKLEQDPRLLRCGAFLRQMSIDELPQLINVIKGEMSMVGPRPMLRREADDYGKNIALYASTKPGITGLWQVSGRSKTSFFQRAALDAWYIRNWSLGYDVIILLRTIGVVLRSRGAY